MKIPVALKESLPLLIAGIVIVGLALHFFADRIVDILLGILGLGTAVVVSKKKAAQKAQTIADEHENMSDSYLLASADQMDAAAKAHGRAKEAAEGPTIPRHDDLPEGFKRTDIRSK